MPAVDPITMQVVRYGLEQIADDMGYTIMRTARSTVIKEVLDFSCTPATPPAASVALWYLAPYWGVCPDCPLPAGQGAHPF
mgnify:CR=1 FL=1